MSLWDDLVFLTMFFCEKNKKECITIAWYRKIFPRHMSNLLSLFFGPYENDLADLPKKSRRKRTKKKHNVDLETWQATATKTQVEIVSLGFVYCDFFTFHHFGAIYFQHLGSKKKWPLFRGQDS